MSTAIGQHFSLGTKVNFPLRWRKKDSKMAGDMVIGTVIIRIQDAIIKREP